MRGKEGAPKPEKSIDIFKNTYYFILFFFLAYLIYYFVFRNLVVRGSGFVVTDIITINAPYNGELIKEFNNTYVKKGDVVYLIKERISSKTPPTLPPSKLIPLKAQYKVKLQEFKTLKKEFDKLDVAHSLELFNPNETQYQNLKNRLNQLKIELKLLSLQIKEYSKIKPPPQKLFSYINHKVISNSNGEIIKQNNNNIVKMGDLLLKIKTNNNLRIIAFFYQKNIKYIKPNDIVTILLPDESEKKGIIQKVTFEKNVLDSQAQQMIKTIIIPIDKNTSFWNQYEFLKIKVRKYKW